ncbi:MAG: OmpA family protein [Prevotellaceae bacterium]|nr:OmpA family protein [Prevotellaceae bacterium]
MKRRTITVSIICLFLSICASAQVKHEFSLSVGGGISTLNYEPNIGKANLFGTDNLGGTAGIGYTLFFTDYIGLGTGGELSLYRQKYTLDDNGLRDYKETQQAVFVNIPLTLQVRAGNNHKFYLNFGGKIGFPVIDDWNKYEIKDGADGKLKFNYSIMATAETGVQWKLSKVTSLYTGVYADFGVTDIMKDADRSQELSTPSTPEIRLATQFNNSALLSSVSGEPIVKNNVAPFALGLKLRLAFTVGKNKSNVDDLKKTETRKERKAREKSEKEAAKQREKDKEKVKAANTNISNPDNLSSEVLEQQLKQEVAQQAQEYSYWEDYFRGQNVQGKTAYEKAIEEIQKTISNFSINEIQLTPDQKADLDKKAKLLKIYPEFSVICVGYTCDLGTDRVNMSVGIARAMVAKRYLMDKGIPENRIMTLSKGSKYPIVDNDTEDHRKQNRRVEFFVLE